MCGRFRWAAWVVLSVSLLFTGTGCKKQEARKTGGGGTPALGETILQIHWLGRKGIEAETNSSAFTEIWNLPESTNLQSRFLDQVSLAPWRLLPGNTNFAVTNPASATLRPLLDDLAESEYYLHVSRLSNQPPEVALALKIEPARAMLWKSNLPPVWNSLRAASNDTRNIWPRGRLEIRQSGDWTLVGIGREGSPMLTALESAIKAAPKPPPGATRLWLEANVALQKMYSAPSWFLPGMPNVEIAMTGNPQGVSTKAILNFPKPLPFEIEPWNIPTNLIHGPIDGFTALQGIKPFISSIAPLSLLFGGVPPNQLFAWSQTPHSSMVYVAAPDDQATNTSGLIKSFLLDHGNAWLAKNASGQFEPLGRSGVFCTAGNPLIGPYLEPVHGPAGDFVLAGLGQSNVTNQPTPDWLVRELLGQTNVIFMEREVTSGRLQSWLYLGQTVRVIFYKSQLPADCPSMKWFNVATPKLRNLFTIAAKTGASQLTVNRGSSVGLNAIELHAFAEWLESSQFPHGTHTMTAEGMTRPGSHRPSNAAPKSVSNANR